MPTLHRYIVFVCCLLFHCAGNWSLPLIDRDEPRFAEASREMRERCDYVVPWFNNQERFDKPPLIYWLQIGAYSLWGENEFAARLPSAVSAALVSVLLAVWGARQYNPATGLRAAIIFALCLQTFIHARAAVADMAMILGVALAAWAGWGWVNGSRRACLAFWVALGLGFLAKGPIAMVPIGMVVAATGLSGLRRGWIWWVGGALVFLAVIASWGVPALVRTNGQFAAVGIGKHVVARSIVALEGHGAKSLWSYIVTLPFYFMTVFPSFFPWSLWLPQTVKHYWPSSERGPFERYLLWGVLLVFGIFSFSRTKLPHYTLPAFPFLALLLAHWWESARSTATFRRMASISALVLLGVAMIGFPFAVAQFPGENLYRQTASWLKPAMEIGSVDYHEPSLVWTFRRKVHGFHKPLSTKKAAAWMARPGPRLCVLPSGELDKIFPNVPADWRVARAEGWHWVKGRRISLTAVVKPE